MATYKYLYSHILAALSTLFLSTPSGALKLIPTGSRGIYSGMESVTIQGALVQVHGQGVLIRGPSGCGKSLTALNLMDRDHLLISDDLVSVAVQADGKLVGSPLEDQVRIEVRGLGVFRASELFQKGTARSAAIDLVVDLDVYDANRDAGMVEPEIGTFTILGRNVPQVRLPLVAGVNPALLIELLAKLLKNVGAVSAE